MHDLYRFGVAPTPHEKLGALIKMENEETKHEENEHEATHGV